MKTLVTFLFITTIAILTAVPSITINAGSIVCVNQAHVIINNGNLVINNQDAFISDNTATVGSGTPAIFEGPEGTSDAMTITPNAAMGSVQIINYSGQRHTNADAGKIKRWWNLIIPSTSTSTIVFRIRTDNDGAGFNLNSLSPYEWNGSRWIKMSTMIPDVIQNGQFHSISFTDVSFLAKKGNHIVTLGNSDDGTLPIELSSFTAVLSQQNYISLRWVTQSETSESGFNIFRNNLDDLATASQVNASLINATNTSSEHTYYFKDEIVTGDDVYFYWLSDVAINGTIAYHGPISVELSNNGQITPPPNIPLVTSLQRIFPNPFNPDATISYGIAKTNPVKISVYNTKGQFVKTLVSEVKDANNYRINWDGKDMNGRSCASGVYFIELTSGKVKSTLKVLLMK